MDSTPDTAPLWTPTPEGVRNSQLERYRRWLADRGIVDVADYAHLLAWSTSDLAGFWRSLWDYFDVVSDTDPGPALVHEVMPGARWFPQARLNYVDQVWRHEPTDEDAIIDCGEPAEGEAAPRVRRTSWRQLRTDVARLAAYLRRAGVQPGDRVVGFLPNIGEAVVAFLATAGIGAVWSACGQDYAPAAAVDRLGQLDPVVLVTADGYRHGGRVHDRRAEVAQLAERLPSVRRVVVVSHLGLGSGDIRDAVAWDEALAEASAQDVSEFSPEHVPFEHPLWVLYSSGTTGKPKGLLHGHGGVLLEHLKQMALHTDVHDGDVYWWFTSPSWMMWNYQVAGLLVGATIVCYDGSPQYPTQGAFFRLAGELGVTALGTSPAYLMACEKAGVEPSVEADLSRLRVIGVTGAMAPPSTYRWVSGHVGDVPLGSISGGTDVVSAFMGWVPTLPVYAGEITAPCLGVAMAAWDPSGHELHDEVGELVITRPMPSMPLHIWNDPGDHRYRDTYFDVYPGVWRHGDWVQITERGTVALHGRSDSTLNRNGIRMGSSDIYEVVDTLPEIADSLVIGAELPDGGYWMPLFVVLADGHVLDDALRSKILTTIRTQASPRHVPDDVIAIPGVPHTKTGKRLEIPVKRILQGQPPAAVVDPNSVDDPALLDVFTKLARER